MALCTGSSTVLRLLGEISFIYRIIEEYEEVCVVRQPAESKEDENDDEHLGHFPHLLLGPTVVLLSSMVHSHWSRNVEARLSLVKTFPVMLAPAVL